MTTSKLPAQAQAAPFDPAAVDVVSNALAARGIPINVSPETIRAMRDDDIGQLLMALVSIAGDHEQRITALEGGGVAL